MEFENIGQHCQYDGCNQKDFLPFRCNSCKKSLCLAHRSVLMHQCTSANMRDITSMDCPICNQCIKFDKSQDPNLIWDDHYMNKCSQQPSSVSSSTEHKTTNTCYKIGCRTILGPSNSFVCRQCLQKVCLTHRIPEEHQCKSLNKANNHHQSLSSNKNTFNNTRNSINKQDEKNKQSLSFNNTNNTTKATKTKASKVAINQNDISNTLKGSASRRKISENPFILTTALTAIAKNQYNPLSKSTIVSHINQQGDDCNVIEYVCPFCQMNSTSEIELMDHIEAFHSYDNIVDTNHNSTSISRDRHTTIQPATIHTTNTNNNHSSNTTTTTNINKMSNNDRATVNSAISSPISNQNNNLREVCPICQLRFIDAIALVQHFESTHNTTTTTNNSNNSNHNGTSNINQSSNNNSTHSSDRKECILS